MQTTEMAVKRVMEAYALLVHPSLEEERVARKRVSAFLAKSKITD